MSCKEFVQITQNSVYHFSLEYTAPCQPLHENIVEPHYNDHLGTGAEGAWYIVKFGILLLWTAHIT